MNTISFGSKNVRNMPKALLINKHAQSLVDNVNQYARGYHMAKSGKVPKDQIEIHAINAMLTGNKSFLDGLMADFKKIFNLK